MDFSLTCFCFALTYLLPSPHHRLIISTLSIVKLRVPALFITKTSLFKYTQKFTPKKENFSDKKLDIFHISVKNIDCWYSLEPPRRCGSNGYPQSMFLNRNKQNNVFPCKPQFYYIKVGLKRGGGGVNII